MRLGIRARNLEIPPGMRSRIEKRVRLSVGHAVADIEALQLTLNGADDPAAVTCQVALRCLNGDRAALEESAVDPSGAVDLALWRLEHWLRRRELR